MGQLETVGAVHGTDRGVAVVAVMDGGPKTVAAVAVHETVHGAVHVVAHAVVVARDSP